MTAKPPSTAPRVSSPQAGPNPASTVGAQAASAGRKPTSGTAASASPSTAAASPGHTPPNALVHVENLTKRYRTTTALRDFSLDLAAGHIVGLMGPNGCGKTTLLKILAGVLADYSGVVAIDGHAPGVATKKIVSYLPDADFLNPAWDAKQAISVYSRFFADFDAKKAASMVDFFELPTNRPLSEMSKGMGEKLQISLVMSRRARVFLLDEPISGVDPATRDVILEGILREFDPQSLLIVSTHLISDIEHFVDYALFVKEGRILLQGDADDLRAAHADSLDAIFRKEYR